METEGSMSQLEYQAHVAAERARKHKAVCARLLKLQQPKMTEFEAAAQYDLVKFWIPEIEKELQRGRTTATNFSYWFRSRSEPEYVNALRDLLGDEFQVTWNVNAWGKATFTEVSW